MLLLEFIDASLQSLGLVGASNRRRRVEPLLQLLAAASQRVDLAARPFQLALVVGLEVDHRRLAAAAADGHAVEESEHADDG